MGSLGYSCGEKWQETFSSLGCPQFSDELEISKKWGRGRWSRCPLHQYAHSPAGRRLPGRAVQFLLSASICGHGPKMRNTVIGTLSSAPRHRMKKKKENRMKNKGVFFQLTPSIHIATWTAPLIAWGVIAEADTTHWEWVWCCFISVYLDFWIGQQQEIAGLSMGLSVLNPVAFAVRRCCSHVALEELTLGCLWVNRAARTYTTSDSSGQEEVGHVLKHAMSSHRSSLEFGVSLVVLVSPSLTTGLDFLRKSPVEIV